MPTASLSSFLRPIKHRRDRLRAQLQAIRERDGGDCRRCRRPIRFDLPPGHDLGARVEPLISGIAGPQGSIDNLCLTHGRCNRNAGDHLQVTERARHKAEIALFDRDRERRRA